MTNDLPDNTIFFPMLVRHFMKHAKQHESMVTGDYSGIAATVNSELMRDKGGKFEYMPAFKELGFELVRMEHPTKPYASKIPTLCIQEEERKKVANAFRVEVKIGSKKSKSPSVKRPSTDWKKVAELVKCKSMTSEQFYQSWEWKEVRYKALKLYGARCMLCGATAANGVRICVDHIKPRSLFPDLQLDINNLQILCDDCNKGKSNTDDTDWR